MIRFNNFCARLTLGRFGTLLRIVSYPIWWLIVLSLTYGIAEAQTVKKESPPPTVEQLWNIREHFVYSVRYGPFKLGTVTLEIMPDSLYKGRKCRYVRTIIKSNPALPFVGHKENIFSSLMVRNDTIPYDVLYWEDDIDSHELKKEIYRLDYQKGKVFVSIKGQPKDTLGLDEPSVCGPAYFFYTRIFAGTNERLRVPLYVNETKNYITMDNTKKTEVIDSEAYPDGKVLTYVSSGIANFDGPFGFSGHYKAWYATGPLRIPIQAYVKVWLGHVKVRLIKYSVIK